MAGDGVFPFNDDERSDFFSGEVGHGSCQRVDFIARHMNDTSARKTSIQAPNSHLFKKVAKLLLEYDDHGNEYDGEKFIQNGGGQKEIKVNRKNIDEGND